MGKETLPTHQTPHEIKKAFLKKVIETRTYLKMPEKTTPHQWSKQRKIGFRYAFKDVTLAELGEQYGQTAESVRLLNHKFLNNIHKNSPPQLQTQYPRETITDRKPLGQKSRERHSKVGGGRSLRIKRAAEERGIAVVGVRDIDDIARAARVTRQQLLASRQVLENWGIHIHRFDGPFPYADFAQKARDENDDKKLQEFLDSFSVSSLMRFMRTDFNRETLTTVSAIANDKGFHAHTKRIKFIAETIIKAKIPIGQISNLDKDGKLLGSYYVVYTKHAERIAAALRNDPDLQRFR